MTHLVTENCIKCKYTDCVKVCPVDCFHEGPNFLVINPDECIDCGVCIPECPVNAIITEDEPAGYDFKKWYTINDKASKVWPVIRAPKEPPHDADMWKDVKDKLHLLQTWDEKFPFKK